MQCFYIAIYGDNACSYKAKWCLLFIAPATSLQATLMVNCMNADVSAKWELTKRHYVDDMNEYCLKYQCTPSLKAEKVS